MAPGVTRSALIFDPDTTPYYVPYLRTTDTAPPLPLRLEGAEFRKELSPNFGDGGAGQAAAVMG